MDMTSIKRWFLMLVVALALGAVAASTTLANPYDGVNRIGTYYQYTSEYQFSGGYGGYQYYDYMSPPRAGGFFGSGTEYIVGLREPYWANVAPVHYTHYYQPTCSWPCWFGGGNGYPRATASQFPYRTRYSGGFGY